MNLPVDCFDIDLCNMSCASVSLLLNALPIINMPLYKAPGRVVQSVGHLTRKSEVLGSVPGLATYFRFSFR